MYAIIHKTEKELKEVTKLLAKGGIFSGEYKKTKSNVLRFITKTGITIKNSTNIYDAIVTAEKNNAHILLSQTFLKNPKIIPYWKIQYSIVDGKEYEEDFIQEALNYINNK